MVEIIVIERCDQRFAIVLNLTICEHILHCCSRIFILRLTCNHSNGFTTIRNKLLVSREEGIGYEIIQLSKMTVAKYGAHYIEVRAARFYFEQQLGIMITSRTTFLV